MTTYEQRLHRFFDIQKTIQVYIDRGTLSHEEFDRVIKDTVKIRRMKIEGLDWLLVDQLLSGCRHVPLLDHCEALAAGLDMEFEGIEHLYRTLIDLEMLPPFLLNRTVFYRVPRRPGLLGEMLVHLGLVSQVEVQRALGIKEMVARQAGVKVAAGQILGALGHISVVDFFQALGLQVGVPFETLDDSAPAIWQGASKRHRTIQPPPAG